MTPTWPVVLADLDEHLREIAALRSEIADLRTRVAELAAERDTARIVGGDR